MRLIVGLGNPGIRYGRTRHNVGWMTVDALVKKLSLGEAREKFYSCIWGPELIGSERVYFIKPLTFMNLSGQAVGEFVRYHPVEPKDILVIYDEMALGLGAVRLRAKGSAGGHNGMKSVIASLGTTEIPRLRIGVGPRPPLVSMVDFVLSSFPDGDLPSLDRALDCAVRASEMWCDRPIEEVMSLFN